MDEIKFESNRGRDIFIAEVIEAIDTHVTNDEAEYLNYWILTDS